MRGLIDGGLTQKLTAVMKEKSAVILTRKGIRVDVIAESQVERERNDQLDRYMIKRERERERKRKERERETETETDMKHTHGLLLSRYTEAIHPSLSSSSIRPKCLLSSPR